MPAFCGDRMRQLLAEVTALGWDEALRRFTSEVLSGALRARSRSAWARVRAKVLGRTWEDTLQDLGDPTRAGWQFLLDLRPAGRVLFLGPSWGAAPLILARSSAHVVVLDGALERLRLGRHQARSAGLDDLSFARVIDPLRLPLADGSVDLAVVPGLREWFEAVAAEQPLSAACGTELLRELRRVLAAGGQAYVGVENRYAVSHLLGGRGPRGASYTPRTFRRAAAAAGFHGCWLFAPIPFRHKFHQVLDLERTDRMNFSADAYRTRGRTLRPLVRAWDVCNRRGAVERRLYPYLPGFAAVLSTEPVATSLAERVLDHLGARANLPPGAARVARYYVRAKGVVVLVAGSPAEGGVIARLPLAEPARVACARHHRALEALAADARIPPRVRRLFPVPLAQGTLDGHAFFAETALEGRSGRFYYSRSGRRYDRAILDAAAVLTELRRVTEEPVTIEEAEFDRLCGRWLVELRQVVREESREALAAIEEWLTQTLVGTRLPLGWHHGDYDLANLLYGPGDRVTGILDFEAFDPRGLPLIDLLLLLARRPIRRQGFAFGTLFTRTMLSRALPPLEAELFERELRLLGADERLYRALAVCGWLGHLRLRRDSWLVRSPSWLEDNLHAVVESVRRVL